MSSAQQQHLGLAYLTQPPLDLPQAVVYHLAQIKMITSELLAVQQTL